MPPPLVVADEGPFNFVVCELLCRYFTSVIVLHRVGTEVLRPNLHIIHDSRLRQIDVKHAGQDHEVQLICVVF